MNLDEIPVVESILELSPEDPVYRNLIIAGPILVVFIGLAGRHPVSYGVAVLYLIVFFSRVTYRATGGM